MIIDIDLNYVSPELYIMSPRYSTGGVCDTYYYTDLVLNSSTVLPSFYALAMFDNINYGSPRNYRSNIFYDGISPNLTYRLRIYSWSNSCADRRSYILFILAKKICPTNYFLFNGL